MLVHVACKETNRFTFRFRRDIAGDTRAIGLALMEIRVIMTLDALPLAVPDDLLDSLLREARDSGAVIGGPINGLDRGR